MGFILIMLYAPGMDLFGKARSDRKFLAQVKEWTIDLIDAGPEDSVVANEIRCDDPDCPLTKPSS